jgi:hypothetical protein
MTHLASASTTLHDLGKNFMLEYYEGSIVRGVQYTDVRPGCMRKEIVFSFAANRSHVSSQAKNQSLGAANPLLSGFSER